MDIELHTPLTGRFHPRFGQPDFGQPERRLPAGVDDDLPRDPRFAAIGLALALAFSLLCWAALAAVLGWVF